MFMVKLFLKTIGLNQKFITNMPMYHALFNICFTGGGGGVTFRGKDARDVPF